MFPKDYPLCLTSVSWSAGEAAGPHVHPQKYRERSSELVYSTVVLTQCEKLGVRWAEPVLSQVIAIFKPYFKAGAWKWKIDRSKVLQLQLMKQNKQLKYKELFKVLQAVIEFYRRLK